MSLVTITNLKCPKCSLSYSSEGEFLRRSSKWRMLRAHELQFACSCGQQMTLRKNNLESHGPSTDDQGVFLAVLHKRLPGLSSSTQRISAALQNAETSNEAVGAMFKLEPLLAARVLFMANAAQESFLSRKEKVTSTPSTAQGRPVSTIGAASPSIHSIVHAIGVLGRSSLVNLLTIAELASLSFGSSKYGQKSFLKDVLAVSSAADFLATKFPSPNYTAEKAYYNAALSVMGRAVQAICYPSAVNRLVAVMAAATVRDPISWEEGEAVLSGLPESSRLGLVAASVWDLTFERSVFDEKSVKRHDAAVAAPEFSLVEVLSAATCLAALATGGVKSSNAYLTSQVLKRFDLGQDEWQAMAATIRAVVRSREAQLTENFPSSPNSAA